VKQEKVCRILYSAERNGGLQMSRPLRIEDERALNYIITSRMSKIDVAFKGRL